MVLASNPADLAGLYRRGGQPGGAEHLPESGFVDDERLRHGARKVFYWPGLYWPGVAVSLWLRAADKPARFMTGKLPAMTDILEFGGH
jgi:hypothetical protein